MAKETLHELDNKCDRKRKSEGRRDAKSNRRERTRLAGVGDPWRPTPANKYVVRAGWRAGLEAGPGATMPDDLPPVKDGELWLMFLFGFVGATKPWCEALKDGTPLTRYLYVSQYVRGLALCGIDWRQGEALARRADMPDCKALLAEREAS